MVQTTSIFEIEETVNQLMAIERQPLDNLNQRRDDLDQQKVIYDLLNASLKTLQSSLDQMRQLSTFEKKEVNVSDKSIIKATAGVGASEIFYDITVSGVAQAARVESDAFLNLDSGTKTKTTGNDLSGDGGSANVNTAITGDLGLDGGATVSAGEFVINDTTIEVTDSDTINTILSKITSSSAGVTAYYDEDNDVVVLEQKTIGSISDIELGSDDTDFFTSMKVTEGTRASYVLGTDKDLYRTLDDVISEGKLAAMTTGYFTINDVTFYVDTSSDSLSDVLNRINSSAANVSMFYDSTLDKVVMTSDKEGDDIYLRNDSTSNFLDSMDILDASGDQNGTANRSQYTGTAAEVYVNGSKLTPDGNEFTVLGTTFTIVSRGDAKVNVKNDDEHLKDKITNFVDQYNNTLAFIDEKRKNELSSDSTLLYLRSSLINKVQSDISNLGNYTNLSRLGIKMGTGDDRGKVTFDTNRFDEAIQTDRESVMKLFAYDSNNNGLYTDGGFANTTYDFVRTYTRPAFGILHYKNEGIDSRVEQMDVSIRRKMESLEKYRINVTEQFIQVNRAIQQMEMLIQSLNSSLQFNQALLTGQFIS